MGGGEARPRAWAWLLHWVVQNRTVISSLVGRKHNVINSHPSEYASRRVVYIWHPNYYRYRVQLKRFDYLIFYRSTFHDSNYTVYLSENPVCSRCYTSRTFMCERAPRNDFMRTEYRQLPEKRFIVCASCCENNNLQRMFCPEKTLLHRFVSRQALYTFADGIIYTT